ncbi:MAG: HAMP domain-containing histidine kinase [Bacteroidales bacterium]|nr:HAMP domain-containing histidine kinase [Bacteroidales bacterium]MCF8404982.1 HAMP domain-containing histidine kinase [Bacteroidales bacterium]
MNKNNFNKDSDIEIQKMKEELARKAEQLNSLQSSFLSNISHEIRTPMNVIVGFSNLLSDNSYTLEQRDFFIEEINKNSRELLRIIDNIIITSKIDTENIKPEMDHFSIDLIMNELHSQVKKFISDFSFNDIKIILSRHKEHKNLIIFTDKDKLKRALLNLIENAIKFTINGTVEYGYKVEDKKVEFYVNDTGIGIERKNLKKVLEKFYKIDESNESGKKGLGVGLSVSDKLIKILGGKLSMKSTLGKGSTFSFKLPVMVEKSV